MKKFEITEETAKPIYKEAPPRLKQMLEESFGKDFFKPKNYERIGSFADAYPIFLKKKFKDHYYRILQKRKVAEMTAIDMLVIIAEVLRGDWKADYGNSNQKKWWAYFQYISKEAGFGFSHAYCGYGTSDTHVGSRLCFPDQELATYFGSHPEFLKLHNEHLLITY